MFATIRWGLSAGFVVGLLSSPPAVADESPIRTSRRPAVRANAVNELEQALGQKTELAFADTPLSDVLNFLSKAHGINIVLDLVALQQIGVTSNVPISVEVSGVTLRSALKAMLPQGLVAVVQDEVLKITTPNRAQPAAAADTPAVTKPRPIYLPAPSPAAVQIQEKFSEGTELALSETPLADALDFLRERHQINIWIDEAALQDEGIDPLTLINLELRGVTLRSALRLMLEPLALTTIVEDEVLKVTTLANAKAKIVTRVYPVGDLIEGLEDLGALQSAIQTATTGWRTEYVAPPGHHYAPSPAVTSPPSPMSPPGTMSVVPRSASLVIKQTYAVHEEIVELLTNLRAAQASDGESPNPKRVLVPLNPLPTY